MRSPDEACRGRRSAPRATCADKPERAPPSRGTRPRRLSTFLRGHYPDQVRRSAAVSATLSARLPELPLRCYPVVRESLRPVVGGVKRGDAPCRRRGEKPSLREALCAGCVSV